MNDTNEWVVSLYKGGQIFQEEIETPNREDALRKAKSLNPTAKVMGISPKYHHPHTQAPI